MTSYTGFFYLVQCLMHIVTTAVLLNPLQHILFSLPVMFYSDGCHPAVLFTIFQ
jgi:hypothetical protein